MSVATRKQFAKVMLKPTKYIGMMKLIYIHIEWKLDTAK